MVLIKLLNLHLIKDKSNICICFIFSFRNTLVSHILENDPSDEVSVFWFICHLRLYLGLLAKDFFYGSADLLTLFKFLARFSFSLWY